MDQLMNIELYYPDFHSLLVLRALSNEVTLFNTLETTREAFTKDAKVLPTTLFAGMSLSTSLHHSTL